MAEDRTWMWRRKNRHGALCDEFKDGVKSFIQFAVYNSGECGVVTEIKCHCVRCMNRYYEDLETVKVHLYNNGFKEGYSFWSQHGEVEGGVGGSSGQTVGGGDYQTEYQQLVIDGFGANADPPDDDDTDLPTFDNESFDALLRDAETPLYDGCPNHTVLSAMSQLLNTKSEGHVSARTFDSMLKTIGEILPVDHKLPKNFYECKKKMAKLGLGYEKIHSCINGCMLYYKEDMHLTSCRICHHDRFKVPPSGRKKGIPHAVLRYLPITPRLQRLYMSTKTAPHMTWHNEHRSRSGTMVHPSDSEAWKHFSRTHEEFALEPRNVRLGLCTDGFTPFDHYGSQYSCWPVILTVYNLPPWMCMKEPYMFLNMIIPGPRHPGKDIVVFLRPLVDELTSLWFEGVPSYDASRKERFTLRAALMWTISDLPAYAMLSGWGTQGKMACPYCMHLGNAITLKHGGKTRHFDCHRKFLPEDHPFRFQADLFRKGVIVDEAPPPILSGEEVFASVSLLPDVTFGKYHKNDKIAGYGQDHHWKKRSIFWELPYWKTALIRHNLDVMHVEKNVFENVFNTVMDVNGKTNYNAKARMDLAMLCNRPELELQERSGKMYKPKAVYCLTRNQQRDIYKWLKKLKLPDGYGSNISRCANVKEVKMTGLKSHDYHIMRQMLLPVALRDMLPDPIWEALAELTCYFRDICSRAVDVGRIRELKLQIVETMCKLEKIFPPAFFDISEHLLVHLPLEAELGGPVQYRWMYPFERFLHGLKKKVGNKAHVEASICEAYIIQETPTFCSFYFADDIDSRINRGPQNDDGGVPAGEDRLSVFRHPIKVYGPRGRSFMEAADVDAAHTYVLLNTSELSPYIGLFEDVMRQEHVHLTAEVLDMLLHTSFADWFKEYVDSHVYEVNEGVYAISRGPSTIVKAYNGCFTNGFNFHTREHGRERIRANSGVCVKGQCGGGGDYNNYYGLIDEIWEVEYLGSRNSVCLLKCHWYDTTRKMRIHPRLGFVELDPRSCYPTNEKFVLASQAEQVFYLGYPGGRRGRKDWVAVCKGKSTGKYDIQGGTESSAADVESSSFQAEHMENDVALDLQEELDNTAILIDPGRFAEVPAIELSVVLNFHGMSREQAAGTSIHAFAEGGNTVGGESQSDDTAESD